MVLELAGDRTLDRPVAGVVDARGDLVEHRALGRGEELTGEHADIAERLRDLRGQGAGGRHLRPDRRRGGHGRAGEDAVLVHVLGAVPIDDPAVRPAAEDHRELAREPHEAFVDQRDIGQVQPFRVGGLHDPPLALAVVAVAAGLEDAGGADLRDGPREVGRRIDRGERRGPAAQPGDEALLAQPVLRRLQRAPVGNGRLLERGQRRDGDVLELVGDDRAVVRELCQRFGIVPLGAGERGAHFRRHALGFGRVDVAAVAELRRGDRDHPAELAAAEDADGRAGGDHAWGEAWRVCFDKLSMSGLSAHRTQSRST